MFYSEKYSNHIKMMVIFEFSMLKLVRIESYIMQIGKIIFTQLSPEVIDEDDESDDDHRLTY